MIIAITIGCDDAWTRRLRRVSEHRNIRNKVSSNKFTKGGENRSAVIKARTSQRATETAFNP